MFLIVLFRHMVHQVGNDKIDSGYSLRFTSNQLQYTMTDILSFIKGKEYTAMNAFIDMFGTMWQSILNTVSSFMPKFFAGLLILFIGLIVASLLKDLLKLVFRYLRLEKWLATLGVAREQEVEIWPNLLAELLRWTTIFIFLMSAVEIWEVPKVGDVLGQLLQFLPNVFLAVIIGWIGLTAGRFAFDIVRHSVKGVGGRETLVLAHVARYAIVFFTVLIVLAQLGVAAELVKILFTGIVGMLVLAFGLSFGLGGQDEAKNILRKLLGKLEDQKLKKRSKS